MVEGWHPTLSPGVFLRDSVFFGLVIFTPFRMFQNESPEKIVNGMFEAGLRGLPSESDEPFPNYGVRRIGLETDVMPSGLCIFLSLHISATVRTFIYP